MISPNDALDFARCDECPLGSYWRQRDAYAPVCAEANPGATATVVGDFPGKQEVIMGRPFVGPSGVEALSALSDAGLAREDFNWTNAVACRFPNDRSEEFLAKLSRSNRKRVKEGKSPRPTPEACCRPRLIAELRAETRLLLMGKSAITSVLPGNASVFDVRGGPTRHEERLVLPTIHPSTVLKPGMKKWARVFALDVAKAKRFFTGTLTWQEPVVTTNPTPGELSSILARWQRERVPVAYDVETDGIDPLTANLRCICFATRTEAVVIGFLSIDGTTRIWSDVDERKHKDIITEFFVDPQVTLLGHNAGYYDRMVVEQWLGVTPRRLVDTILLSRLADSEMPKGLAFRGSIHTDVPAWKSEHTAVTARSDEELWGYCATDGVVTASIAPPLKRLTEKRGQRHLYAIDAALQDVCVGMHRMGMWVDRAQLESRLNEYEIRALEQRQEAVRAFERPDLNPNSYDQIRDIVFRQWSLPAQSFTAAGLESTDDEAIRALLSNPLVEPEQRHALKALRKYRKTNKVLTTYLRPWWARAPRDAYFRICPDYNAHGTVTGRFSSSNPNFQNVPKHLRDIFVAPPGYVLVGADYDQLELRLIAAVAGAQRLLDVFASGVDPHTTTMLDVFGPGIWQLEGAPPEGTITGAAAKGKGPFSSRRDLIKRVRYAGQYDASPETIHSVVTEAEDAEGNFIFASKSVRDIRIIHKKIWKNDPEVGEWWKLMQRTYRKQGWLDEPVMHRRRYFTGTGGKKNELVNFPIQGGGAGIVNAATLRLARGWDPITGERFRAPLPLDVENNFGICNQVHDSLCAICPEERGEEVRDLIQAHMTMRVEGLDVDFTAEAEIGRRWSDT